MDSVIHLLTNGGLGESLTLVLPRRVCAAGQGLVVRGLRLKQGKKFHCLAF